MDTFQAVADPNRRLILSLLAKHGELSASTISDHFSISAPAVSQHLKVLRSAHLVNMKREAQTRMYSVNPYAFTEVEEWVSQITKQWREKFVPLHQVLQSHTKEPSQ